MKIKRRGLFKTLAVSAAVAAVAEFPPMCEYGGNHPEDQCACDPDLMDTFLNFRLFRAGTLGGPLLPRDQWIEVLPPAAIEDFPTDRFMIG